VAAPGTVVNVREKLDAIDERWSLKIIAQVNDLHVKAVKLEGEFLWHRHDDTDELFLITAGALTIRLRDRADVTLGAGELFVVPRGVEHCPVADGVCEVLLLEPAGTVNTGDAPESDRSTAGEWI
jgi:mannose-6-phosphate isomerase-like protein (cupin superfamily)